MTEGYYWVKYASSPYWQPVYWNGEGSWIVDGWAKPLEYYSTIGPRIDEPA